MNNKKENVLKRVNVSIVCMALLIAVMGMTAFAATNGKMKGDYDGTTKIGKATLTNTSGNTRYCGVSVQQGSSISSMTILSHTAGTISSGNTISISGKITKAYARGVGTVYNGGAPQSGIGLTLYTSIK